MGGNANVMNGVIVHYWNGDRNGVYVLDMTPGTVTWSDPALTVGSTFTDTAGGVSVSTAWINATTAGVTVTMGSACLRKNASVSVSPVQQAADPGIAANYTVSVTNNDSGCVNNLGPAPEDFV